MIPARARQPIAPSSAGTGPLSRPAVEAIVAEVIRRLADASPAVGAAGLPSTAVRSIPDRASSESALPDRVITLAAIERLPAGTSTVMIGPQAVVTPSAAEAARDRGIRLDRRSAAGPAAAASSLLVVVAEPTPAAIRFGAACAAAASAADTLSAATLAEAIARLAAAASGGPVRGVLVTSRPAAAVILANRSASLRAVAARDLPSARAGIAETAANVIVCDPATLPHHAAGRLAALLAASDTVPPADLAAAPAGCGCTSHSH